ncbi:MAG: patatin family protein, partial [Bacillus sp. (in: Bacteria)]|nr:patatin family protein [Bacillus sp. (in: firmicutes)]
YNKTITYLESEEKAGNVLIIRPALPLKVGRMERSQRRLAELYDQGYEDAKASITKIVNYVTA